MGQDSGAIRAEIAETRRRLGATVEALAYKTNVRARVGDSIAEKRDSLIATKETLVHAVTDGNVDSEHGGHFVKNASGRAHEILQAIRAAAHRRDDAASPSPVGEETIA